MSSTRQERRRRQQFREKHGATLGEFKSKWLAMFGRLPTDSECDNYEETKRQLKAPLERQQNMTDPPTSSPPLTWAIVTKRHEWDMGHRLPEHDGKCRKLHGHHYVAEIDITGCIQEGGPSSGMVVDFSILKEQLADIIDGHWDHKTMLRANDPIILECIDQNQAHEFGIFAVPFTPTAENIALELFRWLKDRNHANPRINITRVRVYETPDGWAEVFTSRPFAERLFKKT